MSTREGCVVSAPEPVVRAVEKALGCRLEQVTDTRSRCARGGHDLLWWTERGCPRAVEAADAAWVAALPHLLVPIQQWVEQCWGGSAEQDDLLEDLRDLLERTQAASGA